MNTQEKKSILGIALHALFADGKKQKAESLVIDQITTALDFSILEINQAQFYRDILQRRVTLQELANALTNPSYRQIALVTAAKVLHAGNELATPNSKAFIDRVTQALHLDNEGARELLQESVLALPVDDIIAGRIYTANERARRIVLEQSVLAAAMSGIRAALSKMGTLQIQLYMVKKIAELNDLNLGNSRLRELHRGTSRLSTERNIDEADVFASTYAMGMSIQQMLAANHFGEMNQYRHLYTAHLIDGKRFYNGYRAEISLRRRALSPTAVAEIVRSGSFHAETDKLSREIRKLNSASLRAPKEPVTTLPV